MPSTRNRKRSKLRIAGIPTALLIVGAAAVIRAAPAEAGVSCWSGVDSGTSNWAWGSCIGINPNYYEMWRLHVSCTLGLHADSSYYDDNRRADVRCPWPSSVRTTQIQYLGD